ncbi:hypothetical protein [Brevundimonas sp.]|jgi:hypothetical protein|uniref:hypothetical protein n=1 Tax=Brevundimonas sp. TaxID=1871086 RepID=UPI00262D8B0B|nr:hypothetical protein [Brevundimonas sp.]
MRLTDAELSARKRRNVWIAGALVAFIVLIFLTTFLRMQRNLAERKAMQAGVVAEAPR